MIQYSLLDSNWLIIIGCNHCLSSTIHMDWYILYGIVTSSVSTAQLSGVSFLHDLCILQTAAN